MDPNTRGPHEPEPGDDPAGAEAPTPSLAARVAAGSLPHEVDGPIEQRPSDADQGYSPGPTGGRVDEAGATYGADDRRDESASSGGPVTSVGGIQRPTPDTAPD